MSTNELIVGLLVLFGAMEIDRLIAEKALKRLSAEDKAKLPDSSSRQRAFFVVSMLILMVVPFIMRKAWPWSDRMFVWGLLVLFVLISIGGDLFSYVKLKNLSMPKHYVFQFLIRRVVYNGVLFLLFFTLAVRYLSR